MDQEDCTRAGAYMAPAASEEDGAFPVDERTAKEIEKAKCLLESCRRRCSEMLEPAHGRRVTGDLEMRCLDFLENELRYIVACLRTLSAQSVGMEMKAWLQVLNRTASDSIPCALKEADPQPQILVRRAAQCLLRSATESVFRLAEDPCIYRHLLTAISQLEMPPQAAEGGGLLHVGIDWYRHLPTAIAWLGLPPEVDEDGGGLPPVPVAIDWFKRIPPPSYEFGSYLLMFYMVSMFPYGYKFEKDRLVMKWLYEGISNLQTWFPSKEAVGHHPHLSQEVESYHYFSYLDNRNFITRAAASSRCGNPDEAEAWQGNFNHLQHQFIASKSAEVGFIFTSATLSLLAAAPATGHGNETISRIARRLALHHDDPNIPFLLEQIDLTETRSLAVSGAVSGVSVHKFVNLVVLDVDGWVDFRDEDLLQVCRSKMFFLEYLSIRNTRVSKLPPDIKELCNLEILDASYTQVSELPLGVFDATRLRRLDVRGTPIRQVTLPHQILGLQHTLRALLLGVSEGMINSIETATRVPHDIRRFSSLRTLATIDLSEQPASFLNALGDLENLMVLAITWSFHQSTDRDYCEALLSSIKRWSNLESLTIHCGLGCSMEFLGALSGMSLGLETFKVTVGRFVGVPQCLQGLGRLTFVQITVCKLGSHDLETLRHLPELSCLKLGLDFIPREAIVIKNEGFPEVQKFFIDCPVPWLTFESGAMPKLRYLQLNFRAYPMSPTSVPLGISNLASLTEVALYYNLRYANSCRVKMTVEAVRKEVAKCRNATQMIGLFVNDTEQDVQAVDEETQNNATRTSSGTDAGVKDVVEAVDEETENATRASSRTNAGPEDAVQAVHEITEVES